jgi:hypothetical protein
VVVASQNLNRVSLAMRIFAQNVGASINLIVQGKRHDVVAINQSLNNNNICTLDTRGDYGLPFFYSDLSL